MSESRIAQSNAAPRFGAGRVIRTAMIAVAGGREPVPVSEPQ